MTFETIVVEIAKKVCSPKPKYKYGGSIGICIQYCCNPWLTFCLKTSVESRHEMIHIKKLQQNFKEHT